MNYHTSDHAFDTRSGPQSEMRLHIEGLRQLAQAFVRQVEDLEVNGAALQADKLNLYEEVRRFETQLICMALLHARGQQRRAARILGVKATTLNSKIKRYQIEWDAPNIQGPLVAADNSIASPQISDAGS